MTNLSCMCQLLAGTGKSVVLGLLMDMMITHGKQAGLAEDVVDERVLWLGRPPSKSGDLKRIGMFADQLEEKLGALSQLKGIEKELTACKMEIHNAKRLKIELQKILPFSQSWWTSWTQPERGNDVHKFKRLLKDHTKLLMSEVVNNRPLHYSELLSKVKCIVATTDGIRCLLEVEGRPDQGHDRTDGSKSGCPFRRSSAGRG